MNINGINGNNGFSPIRHTNGATKPNAGARPINNADGMNVQKTNGANSQSSQADAEIRIDLVNEIRAEIAAGTYYSDEKLEIALGRMLDSF